jgi:hypothetical protein
MKPQHICTYHSINIGDYKVSTTLKTITVGSILALAAISVAILLRSEATAQPPTTIRTVAAAPQGEWVVVSYGSTDGNVKLERLGDNTFAGVLLMVHTGTGKTRMVKYQVNTPGNPLFMVYDTP